VGQGRHPTGAGVGSTKGRRATALTHTWFRRDGAREVVDARAVGAQLQVRCVIAQANVLDPMARQSQAQHERARHAYRQPRRAGKDCAISAAGPMRQVLVHFDRLRPRKPHIGPVRI
jgi:hypothetical protein